MEKNQIGRILAEANLAADDIAKMKGVKAVPQKTPIIAMIIQNLHESLLALDKGVDVTGVSISPKQIGEGLKGMLDYLRDNAQWTKLQEGLSPVEVNRIVRLTGQIRAASNALLDNT
ncbi:MAG: hypothetical protein HY810_01680 [Candidatus Omnitrophica bacterium]|nr:hypothetical protein [Candidatus Omnitrophota bacterium]